MSGRTRRHWMAAGQATPRILAGYLPSWNLYSGIRVKDIHTSGMAANLTHIIVGPGTITSSVPAASDPNACYQSSISAANSVDGVADAPGAAVKGIFGQLRKLKVLYPHLKVIWTFFGGGSSSGFGPACSDLTNFANNCYNLLTDARWADIFDGMDVDWESPNYGGDTSGFSGYRNLLDALRNRFGDDLLLTTAVSCDASPGGMLDVADFAGGAQFVDWMGPMCYGYAGTWMTHGPAAPHSPLTDWAGFASRYNHTDATIEKLLGKGIPARKILLGVDFFGYGWTGVTQATPGGSATGLATGTITPGVDKYRVLVNTCPPTGTVSGTAYGYLSPNWWSYDTPDTMIGKMRYARSQGLAGGFAWELGGDTATGDLVAAMKTGLA